MTIKKILIANRGEIACRIIDTARKLGIRTVAVYSTADRTAKHVILADEAYLIGDGPSALSYLRGDVIIETALKAGCDAIHPGYGFLSENADFADLVEQRGLIFIGPTGDAMRKMGSKIAAKITAKKAGVPLVPGTEDKIYDIEKAASIAEYIGFPVLIKASAGGGGKGMRVVNDAESFAGEVQRAMSEAQSAFGDSSVFIEKYVSSPKHIEVQILADNYGNAFYLYERECSIQRRHQKLIEEAPSPSINPELRKEMGEAAVRLAKACGYRGAGTIEFLMDGEKNYYFLEMNTRLQVEHPVTECITGWDLVEYQIRIASGEKLKLCQEDIPLIGHAIELRVCAEDPLNQFLPTTGVLTTYVEPYGQGIRVDSGFSQGDQIPVYYDSMIAKLIVHAPNRSAAIEKLKSAIRQYHIEGIATTLEFGAFVLQHPSFIHGTFDTGFVSTYFTEEQLLNYDHALQEAAAVAALYHFKLKEKSIAIPKRK